MEALQHGAMAGPHAVWPQTKSSRGTSTKDGTQPPTQWIPEQQRLSGMSAEWLWTQNTAVSSPHVKPLLGLLLTSYNQATLAERPWPCERRDYRQPGTAHASSCQSRH